MVNRKLCTGVYKRCYGGYYQVLSFIRENETGHVSVLYQDMYGSRKYYVKPLKEFERRMPDFMRHAVNCTNKEYEFELVKPLVQGVNM